MCWLNVLGIIARVISGIVVIGYFLGLFFHDKHDLFDKAWICSGFVALFVGVTKLLVYAVFGGE